jgi:histidine triad (HIT) family protein
MPDCLFCKIAEKKIPSKIVYEDTDLTAFEDINPGAPVHILIVPKKHINSLNAIAEADKEIIGKLFICAKTLAKQKGIAESGYRTVFNTGRDAGMAVEHLHLHLLGGRPFGWPPG